MKKLGFGLMRLPMLDGEIDIEQVKQMVDLFMDRGFTYFDTAYGYHGGKSEVAAKIALVDRYPRESFKLATKLPAWSAKDAEGARQMLYTSLERSGAGYFDYYLLHNLGDKRTEVFENYDLWNFIAEEKKKGTLRNVGFSFHDGAEALDKILTQHPEVDFVQLQINYADWESNTVQSRKCYEVAMKHGKPIIVMEPVKGGALANMLPEVAAPLTAYNPDASQSSWAVRFAASLPGVMMVLSGMSNLQQMDDNTAYMQDFKALSEEELAVIAQVRDLLSKTDHVPCTSCSYCTKDCPMQINIPGVFDALNTVKMYNNLERAKGNYGFATGKGGKAKDCIGCGQCESVCPQHIHIIDMLKVASDLLD